jgi:hypothetical protein
MQLICPTCNLTRNRPYRALRLEVCERCEREGRRSYLVVAAVERPLPPSAADPHPPTRRHG